MYFIGIDIETEGESDGFGLQPFRLKQGKAEITSIAIVGEDGHNFYSALHPEPDYIAKALLLIKEDMPEAVFVGWNMLFDCAWLIGKGLESGLRQMNLLDGEVLLRLLDNSPDKSKSYGLKSAVANYLPQFAGYESEADFNIVNDTLLTYNRMDSYLTACLSKKFYAQLEDNKRHLASVISKGILPFAKAWHEGIHIDREALSSWKQAIDLDLIKTFVNVNNISCTQIETAVLGSPKQLKDFLQAEGVPATSTNKMELSKYAKDYPLVKAILDYKEARTASTKFIAGIEGSLNYNESDTTHPLARIFGTYTGRITYSSKTLKKYPTGIAIHQFPRKPEARNCIVAPKGFLLAEFDFSGQESRLLADYSGDETLLKIFNEGLDIHSYLGSKLAGIGYVDFIQLLQGVNLDHCSRKPYPSQSEIKNFRQLAKVANLSCAYRTSWKRLIDVARSGFGIDMSEAQAKEVHQLFRTTYSRVPDFWRNSIESAIHKGYAESRGGRTVKLYDWSSQNRWAAESTSINFPIQATASDMKFLGIKYTEPFMSAHGGRYMLDLHDALLYLVPDSSDGIELAKQCQIVLSNLPYEAEYGWKPKLQLPVDLKIGHRWGELKGVE